MLLFFLGFQQREVIQSESFLAPQYFAFTFPLKRTHARSVAAWHSYLTERRTDITIISAAAYFQDTEIKMVRGRVWEQVISIAACSWVPITSYNSLSHSTYLTTWQSSTSCLYCITNTIFLTHRSTINACSIIGIIDIKTRQLQFENLR